MNVAGGQVDDQRVVSAPTEEHVCSHRAREDAPVCQPDHERATNTNTRRLTCCARAQRRRIRTAVAALQRQHHAARLEFTAGVSRAVPRAVVARLCSALGAPADRLCPTIPSSHNYLLWLEDLIAPETSSSAVLGVDIGTGASCIYPLLGVAQRGWHFIATEVDPLSVAAARHNVSLNC